MIAMSDKTAFANMLTDGQRFLHPASAPAAILTRELGGNPHYSTTSFLRFVFEYACKGSPARITDAFRKLMVLHHPLDVQILNRNVVKLPDDIQSGLVVKVRALALNLLMFPGKKFDGFSPPVTPLIGSAGDPALSRLQLPLGGSVVFRVLDYFARRERGEVLNANVNPDAIAGLRNISALVLFDNKDHVPAVGFALDRAGLDDSLDRTRETDTNGADLAQVELVSCEPETALRVGERVVSRRRLESRRARFFPLRHSAKERIKGLADASKHVLRHLRVNGVKVFANGLDLRQLNGLRVIVDRNPVHCPGVTAFLKSSVIKLAASLQRRFALAYKCFISLQLELVCLHKPYFTQTVRRVQRIISTKRRNAKFISIQIAQDGDYGWSILSRNG